MRTHKLLMYSVRATAVIAFAIVGWLSWIPGSHTPEHKVATLAQLPLSFEVNRGQAAADAKFVARGGGYSLLLTDRAEPVLALHGRPRRPAQRRDERQRQASRAGEFRQPTERVLLRLEFPGGNPSPQVQGEQPLPGRSNYLIGNDPGKWLTGVPHFARVRYHEVFPGVDVLYYATGQQLEYDFLVHPGTSPDSIRLKVKGALAIERSELGNLVLKTAAGRVLLHKPVAYQQGPGGEREVACSYLLDQKGEVGFALGDYDRSQPLRIDPVLSYAAQMDASIQAIAVDSSGNSYLAGVTSSANFPTTAAAFQPSYGGNSDAVIAKIDPAGSTLLFATYLGGSQEDSADGIALDSAGNVILVGSTRSTNFPVTNAAQPTLSGNMDAFLSKLDATGMQLMYSTYLGGQADDLAKGVGLDASGRPLVTGRTDSPNFPTSVGAFQTTFGTNHDAFVAKLDPTMTGAASLLFSTYLGGSGEDEALAIAVDGAGSAFLTGRTLSTNFPTANPIQSSCASCVSQVSDAFVTKLNANGTALVYSTFLGGTGQDESKSVALDSLGNAHVAGETTSINFPTTTGAFQTSNHGGLDAFVSKLNAAGSSLLYSTFVGGSASDSARGISLDSAGNAFLTGYTLSADFPTVAPFQRTNGADCGYYYYSYYACSDAVVPQLNASGSALIYSTYLGGAGAHDFGSAIAVDGAGNAYVAGSAGATFPFTQGALQMPGGGFVAKISPQNAPGLNFDTRQVNFGVHLVGTTNSTRFVLLRNLGSTTLNISSVSVSGDFTQTNDCGTSVSAAGNCTIQLTFSPTAVGPHSGMLTVNNDAAGSPHSIPLSGTGTLGVTTTTTLASSLNPSNRGQVVTFTATITPQGATGQVTFLDGNTEIGFAGINPSGTATFSINSLFGGNHSITASYAGDGVFLPSASTALTQIVNSITMTTTASSATVPRGGTATFMLTVGQAGALSAPITFSCPGLQVGWNCTFNPTSVPAGSGQTTVALSVLAGSSMAQNLPQTPAVNRELPPSAWSVVLALLMLGIPLTVRRRKAAWLRSAATLGLAVLFLVSAGCGGSDPAPAAPPRPVNVTVNATSGSTTSSATVAITAQ